MHPALRRYALLGLCLALLGCESSPSSLKAPITPDSTVSPSGNLPEACFTRGEAGTCEALIMKYEFNPETGQCQDFFWGGCEGVVPFETLEACQTACES